MRALRIAAAVAGLALLSACSAVTAATETELESAYNDCTQDTDDSTDSDDFADKIRLADEGHTLIVETTGEEDMDGYLAFLCVTIELGTSERVTSSIETTTSMMGRQSSTDGNLTYEYTYHPDNGLYVLITDGRS